MPQSPRALELYHNLDDSKSFRSQDVQLAWLRAVHTVAGPSLLIHASIDLCSAFGL